MMHSQQVLVTDGNHLEGSRHGSSEQIRMVSACGPMHPLEVSYAHLSIMHYANSPLSC